MSSSNAPQGDSTLIATWKKAVAVPIAAFFGLGCVTYVFQGKFDGALMFLALTLLPVLYLLTLRRRALKRRHAAAQYGSPVNIGPNWLLFGVPAVLALFVVSAVLTESGFDPDPNALVPNVIGTSLSDARTTLRNAGLKTETEDDTGQGRQV